MDHARPWRLALDHETLGAAGRRNLAGRRPGRRDAQ
jgi:hypothetical protein